MTRSRGKHQVREAQVVADTPAGDEIGMSNRTAGIDSPIPGGRNHITNAPTARQQIPVPMSRPEHHGTLAHGVPPDAHTFRERAELERGPNDFKPQAPTYAQPAVGVRPIPVAVVEPSWGDRALRTFAGDVLTVPPAGSDPIRIAGRDRARSHILLLVETMAGLSGSAPTGIRVDHSLTNLEVGQGALVRSPLVSAQTNSYLKLDCNDEMFAVSNDGSACILSVIYLYGEEGAG
jgi:hypothetical protein